jgi:hypothetical protein
MDLVAAQVREGLGAGSEFRPVLPTFLGQWLAASEECQRKVLGY